MFIVSAIIIVPAFLPFPTLSSLTLSPPQTNPHIAVWVHGLCMNALWWSLHPLSSHPPTPSVSCLTDFSSMIYGGNSHSFQPRAVWHYFICSMKKKSHKNIKGKKHCIVQSFSRTSIPEEVLWLTEQNSESKICSLSIFHKTKQLPGWKGSFFKMLLIPFWHQKQ